jgi:hypothetical protein
VTSHRYSRFVVIKEHVLLLGMIFIKLRDGHTSRKRLCSQSLSMELVLPMLRFFQKGKR